MCSAPTSEQYRYNDDDRDAREKYYQARADMREAKRPGTPWFAKWNAHKRSNFFGRLVSAFDEGIHEGNVVLHTLAGAFVQCTCGLLGQDDAELEQSNGHLDMQSWEVDTTVILRVSRAADRRSDPQPYVARCQRCGQASPRCELKTANAWQATHQCDESTNPASRQETSGSVESVPGERS